MCLLNTTKCIMITIYICIYIIMCIITFIRFVVLPEVDTVAPHMSHIPGLSPFSFKMCPDQTSLSFGRSRNG